MKIYCSAATTEPWAAQGETAVGVLEPTVIDEVKLHDGDDDFPPYDFDEGKRPGRCNWNVSVCTDTPTHRVVMAMPGGEPDLDSDPEIFCARHYGAWLARWVLLHEAESGCSAPPAQHFYFYGPITDTAGKE